MFIRRLVSAWSVFAVFTFALTAWGEESSTDMCCRPHPADWLSCRTSEDCVLVYGCGDEPINKDHRSQIHAYPNCPAHNPDIVVSCTNHQCSAGLPTVASPSPAEPPWLAYDPSPFRAAHPDWIKCQSDDQCAISHPARICTAPYALNKKYAQDYDQSGGLLEACGPLPTPMPCPAGYTCYPLVAKCINQECISVWGKKN